MTHDNTTQQERLEALLALALDRHEQTGAPCPDHEMLVAWHEQKLDQAERANLTQHLNGCADCYRIWSELAEPIGEMQGCHSPQQKGQGAQDHIARRLVAWLQSVFQPHPWAFGGVGGALGVALVVMLLLPAIRLDRINRGINRGFQALPSGVRGSVLPPAPASPYVSKSLPPSMGINGWQTKSPALQAFGLGVRQAMEKSTRLAEADRLFFEQLPQRVSREPAGISPRDWEKRKKALIAAGRWTVLLRQACAYPGVLPPEFWADQGKVRSQLATELTTTLEEDQFSRLFHEWVPLELSQEGFCAPAVELIEQCR